MPTYERGVVFEMAKKSVLDSIQGFDIEFIVINDSKKSPIVLLKEEQALIRVYDNPKQGVASARNYGVSLASSDIIMFLDDDMILRPENIKHIFSLLKRVDMSNTCFNIDWIYPPQLISKIEKTKFGRFLIQNGFTTMRGWANYPDWPENSFFEVDGLASYCLVISKSNFIKIKGYNENFPHAGFEDDEFSRRVIKECKIFLSTQSLLWHNESDRVEIKDWLLRKERGGETRKVAVDLGRKDLELSYSPLKRIAYKVINFIKTPVIGALELLPNNRMFDSLYSRGIKTLLGTATFVGYNKETNRK